MLVYLLHKLGVTPNGDGKTGGREATWTLIVIALSLTVTSMFMGPEMVHAMTAILAALWSASVAALVYVYKLKGDQSSQVLPFGGADNQFHSQEGGVDDTRVG